MQHANMPKCERREGRAHLVVLLLVEVHGDDAESSLSTKAACTREDGAGWRGERQPVGGGGRGEGGSASPKQFDHGSSLYQA